MQILPDDWISVFAPQTPLVELLARGAVLYFGILILMRFMPRRSAGELAFMDLVFALLNAMSYHVPLIERLVSAPPLQIIRNGKLLRQNMQREFLTEEELMSHLHQQGIDEVKDVKAAFIKGEGKITVIGRKSGK